MAYIPIVIENEGRNERSYDLWSRLLKDRIIIVNDTIEDTMASIICGEILFLASEDKNTPICMYINSPGGSVTAGLAIYDVMRTCNCPIETVVMGQACSMGAWLLAAGTKGHRIALDSARIMIHQVASGCSGKETDMAIALEETTRLKKFLTEKLAEFTGKKYKQVYDDCERDKYMSAQEALEYGLVDKVI